MRNKISILFALFVLVSCGQQQPEEQLAPGTKTGGQLGDSTWNMSSAVVFNENGHFDITIAGEGDSISCDNPVPSKTHLSFRVPNRVGKYEFSISNPNTNPVFFVFSNGGKVDMVIAKQSLVDILSFNASRLRGSLTAESSGSGPKAGKVSGSFEAIFCKSN